MGHMVVTGAEASLTDANARVQELRARIEEASAAYYDRDANGVSQRWLAVVKEAIRTVAPRFSARRMVKEYVERMYAPALERRRTVNQ